VSILKNVRDLLSPSDPELVEKTLARLNEQDTWNDVFSTKLIELLDNIDRVKSEIRARLRKAESVAQAESLLLEKAAKYGDAARRLELAEAAQQRATSLAADAKDQLVKATAALDGARKLAAEARNLAEDANRKFCLSQEAALKSTALARLTVCYGTVAVGLSWIAVGWTAWFMVRTTPFFWAAICLSVLIAAAAAVLVRRTSR
jgi:hypothetical protein